MKPKSHMHPRLLVLGALSAACIAVVGVLPLVSARLGPVASLPFEDHGGESLEGVNMPLVPTSSQALTQDRLPANPRETEAVSSPAVDHGQSLQEELDTLVNSFRGSQPRLDELSTTIRKMGDNARVVEGSVRRSGNVVSGELKVQGLADNPKFRIEGNFVGIELGLRSVCDEPYKSISVTFSTELNGAVQQGFVGVHHHIEAHQPELASLGSEAVIVGWTQSTSLSTGSTIRPIMCARSSDGSTLRVGRLREHGDARAEERPWDWDLSKFGGWHAAVRPLMSDN